MRTAPCVMIALLFFQWGVVSAQTADSAGGGTLDSDVTIVGRDETAIPVPPPWHQQEVAVPEPDMTPPDPMTLPPIPPPVGADTSPGEDAPVLGDSGEPLP
jgi:hypothetical protein